MTRLWKYPDESTNGFVRVKNNIFLYTEVNFLILLKYNFILVENRVAIVARSLFMYKRIIVDEREALGYWIV